VHSGVSGNRARKSECLEKLHCEYR
jgi:hypothetical protein